MKISEVNLQDQIVDSDPKNQAERQENHNIRSAQLKHFNNETQMLHAKDPEDE